MTTTTAATPKDAWAPYSLSTFIVAKDGLGGTSTLGAFDTNYGELSKFREFERCTLSRSEPLDTK